MVDELTTIVRSSDQYQRAEAAGRLIKIPTGDGMALVFYTSPEAPAQCAIEISVALKKHPRLQVRMGVHSGPVSGVIDVNGHANLAGAGLTWRNGLWPAEMPDTFLSQSTSPKIWKNTNIGARCCTILGLRSETRNAFLS